MKIWKMNMPLDTPFAEAALGSPMIEAVPATCRECGAGAQYEMPQPLVIEWEPGSDTIGDFVWATASRVAVRLEVLEQLQRHFGGFTAGPLEMYQDPKLKPPKRITKKTQPRVWLPYKGPELYEMWVTGRGEAHPKSSFVAYDTCTKCGNEELRLEGVEWREHRYDLKKKGLVPVHTPRESGRGLFVKKKSLSGVDVFHVGGIRLLCTDRVKAFVEKHKFTNIDFLEFGDLV